MSTDKTHYGKSKVERYKWTLVDVPKPGEMRLVDKRALAVNHEYQRSAFESKVLRMARDFSWIAFGAITVSERDGGLFVVDGQHRLQAALRRDDVSQVPCIIYKLGDIREEAKAFLSLNGDRKPVTSSGKFKAEICAGDQVAAMVNKLILDSGRVLGSGNSANTVACIGILLACANENSERFKALWPVIVEFSKGRSIQNSFIKGLWYAEGKMPEGASFCRGRWMDRLLEVGYEAVTASIKKASAYHGAGTPKVLAEGILNAVNYKLRNTLTLNS